MKRFSTEDEARVALAVDHMRASQYEAALRVLTSLFDKTEIPEQRVTTLLLAANCQRSLGMNTAAISTAECALREARIDIDKVDSHVVLSDALMAGGKLQEALRVIDKSLQMYPGINDSDLLAKKGHALALSSEFNEALICLQRSLELDPAPPDLGIMNHMIGYCLYSLTKYSEALAFLDKASQMELPNDYGPKNDYYRGLALMKLGDLPKARQALSSAESQPNKSGPLLVSKVIEAQIALATQLDDYETAEKYRRILTGKAN